MSVLLFLSAGRGPRECGWALGHLVRRLEATAPGSERLETTMHDGLPRSVLIRISGDGAEQFAASWTGTLCWQAPSPYRTGPGRKNWYVTARRVTQGPVAAVFDERDVDVVACRTGGPGGQHRNKASTAARVTHRPTGTVVVADRERHFALNRRVALDLLRHRLADREAAAGRASVTARWRLHDELIRGDPVRIERPGPT